MLKTALLSGCVLGICASLFDFAAVNEKYSKNIKQLVSLLLIIIVASALFKTDLSSVISSGKIELDDYVEPQAQSVMSSAVSEETSKKLKEYVLSVLSCSGIYPLDVSIQLTVNKDNLIAIKEINIVLKDEDKQRAEYVREMISDEIPQGELNVKWEE